LIAPWTRTLNVNATYVLGTPSAKKFSTLWMTIVWRRRGPVIRVDTGICEVKLWLIIKRLQNGCEMSVIAHRLKNATP
jgi:hypothetical protein